MALGTAQRRSVGAAGADGNTVGGDDDLLGWIVLELEEGGAPSKKLSPPAASG
jgi:hypothetical protein